MNIDDNVIASDRRIDDSVIDSIRYVIFVTKHLVNNPEEVKVDIHRNGYTVVVSLETNPEDVGQVVGKNAYIITSIRSLLASIAGKNGIKIHMDYITEEDKKRERTLNGNHY
jgi:predicted RNA-binding protein YlqC (UPF0109 family)